MAGPSFDPSGAVRFDLRNGAASDAKGKRVVLIPVEALSALGDGQRLALAMIGQATGQACGARVASRLGGDAGVRKASLEDVVSHLAGELAVAGLGMLHIERWGRALVCVLAQAPIADEASLEETLSGALSSATGREVMCACMGAEGGQTKFFCGAAATADRVRTAVGEGKRPAEILASLQEGGAS